ncbi:hypothetical protein FTO70_13360 [Methanosarcina sp. KYL-1]|uniref:hypothetical protein n=1 Tax=Methanosarcina sp. KYL-1 TaxID=2602068 RepID=UPI00210088F2|nr:hypothetical protein [Methanosarcina sp. KYL-1]MCQ1536638.1 hypothetical protein [Methanosarcina sp. KYL-1]
MQINRLSSITRSIDLSYPTNRAIAVISLLFLFGIAYFQLFSGKPVSVALVSGFRAGFSVFFAWALAREIDPDNELSAFAAAFMACLFFLYFLSPFFPSPFLPSPGLLALFLFLLSIRIINRSTGLPAKLSDSVGVLLLSGWLSLQESWIFGLIAALAFFLDGFLPGPNRNHRVFSGAAFLISLFALSGAGAAGTVEVAGGKEVIFGDAGMLVLAASFLFLPHIFFSRKIRTKGDLSGSPLTPIRVQAAQLSSLAGALLLAGLEGWWGIEVLMPFWGALIGVPIYGYARLLLQMLSKA